ncbi:MAG TPA: hypothetical protein DCL08_08895 [Anaerolineaceae bacterium]|nr:hypothetical protein [Anaerolineaceae bacterium]
MKMISRLFDWFSDFWPIFFIIILIILHIFLLNFFTDFTITINTVISSLTQLSGGIISLIIISKNFSQFRHMNLFSWLKKKIRSFPLKKQHYKLEARSSQHAFLTGEVHAHVKRRWDSLEEGLQELERRIDELRDETVERDKDIKREISSLRHTLNGSINNNSQKINEVQTLLEVSVLDDIHIQIFGALLILYGFTIDILLIK